MPEMLGPARTARFHVVPSANRRLGYFNDRLMEDHRLPVTADVKEAVLSVVGVRARHDNEADAQLPALVAFADMYGGTGIRARRNGHKGAARSAFVETPALLKPFGDIYVTGVHRTPLAGTAPFH